MTAILRTRTLVALVACCAARRRCSSPRAAAAAAAAARQTARVADDVAVVGARRSRRRTSTMLLAAGAARAYGAEAAFRRPGSTEYDDGVQHQIVAYLVQHAELEQQGARSSGVKVTAEGHRQARSTTIKKQYFGGSTTSFQAAMKKQGLTDAAVRARTSALQLAPAEADRRSCTKDVKVTDTEPRAYYDKNKAQYTKPPSARPRAHPGQDEGARRADLHAAPERRRLRDAREEVLDRTRARRRPAASSASRPRRPLVPPFDKVAFTLKTDPISKPVKTAVRLAHHQGARPRASGDDDAVQQVKARSIQHAAPAGRRTRRRSRRGRRRSQDGLLRQAGQVRRPATRRRPRPSPRRRRPPRRRPAG